MRSQKYNRRRSLDTNRHRSRVFAVPRLNAAYSASRPLPSLGLAVHPNQVGEFNQMYQEHGITSAYHTADGMCQLESRQARNEVLKLRGMRDNDAGYGDWSGVNG